MDPDVEAAGWRWPGALDRPAPPACPVEGLPGWLGDWVAAISEEKQTPRWLACLGALGALSLASRGLWSVDAKGDGRWLEPLGLYTACVLAPGERKSAVASAVSSPVRAWARDRERRTRAARSLAEENVRWLEKAIKRQRVRADAMDREAAQVVWGEIQRLKEDLRGARAEAHDDSALLLGRDVTPEALLDVLGEQGGCGGMIEAEGTMFKMLAGRYNSGQANIEGVLSAHAREPIDVRRKGSPRIRLDNPYLVLSLAVQPGVMAALGGQAAFTDLGLIGRFLFAVPEPRVGARSVSSARMPVGVRERYALHLRALLDLGVLPGSGGVLRWAPGVGAAFNAWDAEVERELRAVVGALADLGGWGGKLAGATCRLAGVLHLAEWAGQGEVPVEVSGDTLGAAVRLARALMGHALIAFGLVSGCDMQEQAGWVCTWLRRWRVRTGGMAIRRAEVRAAMRHRLPAAADLDAALEALVDRGYVREAVPVGQRGRGRPSVVIELNPGYFCG